MSSPEKKWFVSLISLLAEVTMVWTQDCCSTLYLLVDFLKNILLAFPATNYLL